MHVRLLLKLVNNLVTSTHRDVDRHAARNTAFRPVATPTGKSHPWVRIGCDPVRRFKHDVELSIFAGATQSKPLVRMLCFWIDLDLAPRRIELDVVGKRFENDV